MKSLFPKRVKSTFGTSEKKQVSLTEFIHVSMGKQNVDLKKMYLPELSRSKFHSVTSSNVILYNDV